MSSWTLKELKTLWSYADLSAKALEQFLPNHTAQAIRTARARYGRYSPDIQQHCCMCGKGAIWNENKAALRYQLCKACYQDKTRLEVEHQARHHKALKAAQVAKELKRAQRRAAQQIIGG